MQEVRDYTKLNHKIVATTLCYSFVPLIALGHGMYALFSDSITAGTMNSIRTLAENRRNAIDLFLEERIARLHKLAYTHSIDQLRAEGHLVSALNLVQTGVSG